MYRVPIITPVRIENTLRIKIGLRRSADVEKKKSETAIGTKNAVPVVTIISTVKEDTMAA